MRISSLIFSFYLVFLAIHPALTELDLFTATETRSCCAGSCSTGDNEDQSQNEENSDSKSCNPFQSCECCVCIKTETSFSLNTPVILHGDISLLLNEEIPLQVSNDFWQPPKMI